LWNGRLQVRAPLLSKAPEMAAEQITALRSREVSLWLDTLSRDLLEDGGFAALIGDSGVTGATSNPTIFERAIRGSDRYDAQIADALAAGHDDAATLFRELTVEDVARAASLLAPTWEESRGDDGYVSVQCNPDLADDADATVADARDLWMRLAEPNVLIKVAATDAGIDAIEDLTAGGVSVNVTLLFSRRRYLQAIEAFMRGLERRVEHGLSIREIRSVASFFVSRVDAKADERLAPESEFVGKIGIANARSALARFGLDQVDAIGAELERAGVDAFRRSYREALAHIRARVADLRGGSELGVAAA
jgi:transaldolase